VARFAKMTSGTGFRLMSSPSADMGSNMNRFDVLRTDDNGRTFTIKKDLPRDEAEKLCAELTARGHKQHYFLQKRDPSN
jgi:hypothetical protein